MATIDDLRNTFFEECSEGLEAIENGLGELERDSGTDDTVNAVFRAIHSIKGGAGVFGFAGLVEFAHVFESVLDAVRHGNLQPSVAVIEVLLAANDTLADLVQFARSGQVAQEGFGSASRSALNELLAGEVGQGGDAAGVTPADFDGIDFKPVRAEDTCDLAQGERQTLRLAYLPKTVTYEGEYGAVFARMAEFGQLNLVVDQSAIPDLDGFDPAKVYLQWHGELCTASPIDEVRAALQVVDHNAEWIVDDSAGDLTTEAMSVPTSVVDTEMLAPEAVRPRAAEPVNSGSPAEEAQTAVANAAPEKSAADSAPSKSGASNTTIRVELDKIDRIVNMVGELVISQTMLRELFNNIPSSSDVRMSQVMEDVFLHTRELKNSVMSMRAQPVRSVFQRMSRVVRELSTRNKKKISLETHGEGTEVDKTVIERLSDPLTHIIRNAVDHGIETPDRRKEAGKPDEGSIRLSADQRSSRIVIEISDDGAGIDSTRVLSMAKEKGLVAADAVLSEDEINNLIFLPGFSTAETISDISGRGVGMDVVRRNIQDLGGRISLKSQRGKGMKIQLSLPLTLAVMDGMIVKVGRETYVVPIGCIVECIRPLRSEITPLIGTHGALRLRGSVVPLMYLAEILDIEASSEQSDDTTVIIIETSEGLRVGLVVDQLCGHQQVVIKSIEDNYGAVPGVAGATILGDGRVAFILDAERLGDFAAEASQPVLSAQFPQQLVAVR